MAKLQSPATARRGELWMRIVATSCFIRFEDMSKSGRSISVRAGRLEFHKINTAKFRLARHVSFHSDLNMAEVRGIGPGHLRADQSCLCRLVRPWRQVHRRTAARFVFRGVFL